MKSPSSLSGVSSTQAKVVRSPHGAFPKPLIHRTEGLESGTVLNKITVVL